MLTIWSWQNGRWDYQQAWCKWCKTTVSHAHRLCASGIWARLSRVVSTWCQWTAGATVICRLPGLEDPHCTWCPHMAGSVQACAHTCNHPHILALNCSSTFHLPTLTPSWVNYSFTPLVISSSLVSLAHSLTYLSFIHEPICSVNPQSLRWQAPSPILFSYLFI